MESPQRVAATDECVELVKTAQACDECKEQDSKYTCPSEPLKRMLTRSMLVNFWRWPVPLCDRCLPFTALIAI